MSHPPSSRWLVIHNQSTHEQNNGIMDDIMPTWLKNCDEFSYPFCFWTSKVLWVYIESNLNATHVFFLVYIIYHIRSTYLMNLLLHNMSPSRKYDRMVLCWLPSLERCSYFGMYIVVPLPCRLFIGNCFVCYMCRFINPNLKKHHFSRYFLRF